jgi:hypothetical protein
MPGQVPPSNCDDTPEDCMPPMPACATDPCVAGSPCLAMTQNVSGQPADLRIRKLNITAPPSLVMAPTHFLQMSIIDQGVNLKNACGEGGDGSFSWLVHFDAAGKQVTTGGAPPTDKPFDVGYCFVREKIAGLDVQPVTVGVTQGADGSWTSDTIPKLYVPIYVHAMANNVVVLPLTNATVQRVTLSPDGNCIGSYNPIGATAQDVGAACSDTDPSGCVRWRTAGALGGFITLEEADKVYIQDLSKSLCVLLTRGEALDPTGQYCGRDAQGKLMVAGDFCSTTNTPGGCADSYWLAATFAASAAKINDGSQDPACNGTGMVGTDGGGPDGGADASDGGPG